MPPDDGNEKREKCLITQLNIVQKTNGDIGSTNWTVFSIFFAANAILMAALVNSKFSIVGGLILSLFGVFLSIVWFLLQSRITQFERFYEKVQLDLERELYTPVSAPENDPEKPPEFIRKYSVGKGNNQYKKFMGGELYEYFGAKNIMRFVPLFLLFVWGVMLILCFIGLIFTPYCFR